MGGVRLEQWLRWSAHPLGSTVCRVPSPSFALSTSEMAIGFWPFCILLFIFTPQLCILQLFLVSLCSVAPGDVRPGASIDIKGPSLSH